MSIDYNEVKKNVKDIGNGLKHCPSCGLIYGSGDGIYHKGYHERMLEFYKFNDPQGTIWPYYQDPEEIRRNALQAETEEKYREAVMTFIAHYYRSLFIAQGAHGPYDRRGELISPQRYIQMFLGANGDMSLPSIKGFGPKVFADLIREYGVNSGLEAGTATELSD